MIINSNRVNIQNIAESNQEFLELLIRSIDEPVIQGVKFPGFPPASIQSKYVGSSNEKALRAGYRFYKAVREYCHLYHPLNPDSRILDFGCGWGRITRFFFNDVKSENVIGVDVDPDIIEFCKSDMHYGKWFVVNPVAPTKIWEKLFPYYRLKGNSFDLVFAHSVFSHLEENVARLWIEEFSRLLRPEGLLIITTWGRTFLDRCESLRGEDHQSSAHKNWAQAFISVEKAKEDYDQGKFLFEPTPDHEGGILDKSFFGLSLIPRKYVEKEYTRYLKLLDFVDEKVKDPQAVFVMQKT